MLASATQSHQRAASRTEQSSGLRSSRRQTALGEPVSQTLQDCPAVGSSQHRNQVDREDRQRLSQHPCRAGG